MSSEQARTPTQGALNREQALPIIVNWRTQYLITPGDLLDALEACVVADPRIARIEALPSVRGMVSAVALRTILRGDQ